MAAARCPLKLHCPILCDFADSVANRTEAVADRAYYCHEGRVTRRQFLRNTAAQPASTTVTDYAWRLDFDCKVRLAAAAYAEVPMRIFHIRHFHNMREKYVNKSFVHGG